VNARRPRRVVDVAATLEAISTLAEILTQYGPLHKDEIAQHCRDRGMDDPDSAIQWNLLEIDCPARQLVDDRWVWLPEVLAGRVFTHRVSADESTHDVLTVTPDLDPITTLFEHEQYQALADGSTACIVLAGYDNELLDVRGIPAEAVDSAGALLLKPGALAALGVGDGDTVGLRLTQRESSSSGSTSSRSTRRARGWPRLSARTNRAFSRQRPGPRVSRTPHCSPIRCRP
jgi:hypothetical protein